MRSDPDNAQAYRAIEIHKTIGLPVGERVSQMHDPRTGGAKP